MEATNQGKGTDSSRHPLKDDPHTPRERECGGEALGSRKKASGGEGSAESALGGGAHEGKEAVRLTFPQPVLEVGVAPPLAVEIDAVADEKGAADASGDSAALAPHHFLLFAPARLALL